MGAVYGGTFDEPSEVRRFDKGRFEVVRVGGESIARAVFEPGWRWSESVGSLIGADRCPARHVGYVVSGRLRVAADDGTEAEAGPGDVYVIEPGHDGWVVGDEPFIGIEFGAADTFATP